MIIEKKGNLLEAGDVDVICHCCNLFHTFGAGIALQIKKKFPEAYAADCATKHGDVAKLGTNSYAVVEGGVLVANCYAMKGIGTHIRQVDYEALISCFENLKKKIKDSTTHFDSIGIPHGMGCGLAGGDFRIVRAILESVFDKSGIDIYIYRYEA